MGTSLSRSFSRYWNRNDRRLLLVGLDGAGKTTVLYHLRLGKAIASIPTVGFNVETIKFDGYKLNIWVRWLQVASWDRPAHVSAAQLLGCRRTGHAPAILEASLHRHAGTE
jgi:GTPase SAR1 family protein